MNTQRINIFNKTHGNDVIISIPYHFQFQFFPTENGFFHQNLTHQTGLQASGAYHFQFFFIIHKAAACSSHSVSRAKNHRISQFLRNRKSLLHRIGYFAAGHLNAQFIHGILKFNTVFSALNGIYLHTNDFDIVFIQNAGLIQFRTQIKPGLPSQIREQRIGAFLCNNLFQTFYIKRLNISHIRRFRICHNGSRIGIDKYNLIS